MRNQDRQVYPQIGEGPDPNYDRANPGGEGPFTAPRQGRTEQSKFTGHARFAGEHFGRLQQFVAVKSFLRGAIQLFARILYISKGVSGISMICRWWPTTAPFTGSLSAIRVPSRTRWLQIPAISGMTKRPVNSTCPRPRGTPELNVSTPAGPRLTPGWNDLPLPKKYYQYQFAWNRSMSRMSNRT